MNPTARYDLRPGEWRPDPPHVSYGCDRSKVVALLIEELRAAPWTHGESDEGPAIEVKGRTLGRPPSADDLKWLTGLATPAPYGRGEETLLDPEVRDALQIETRDVVFEGPAWEGLRAKMLEAVAAAMGLADATLRLEPLKLLIYRAGGHFAMHADTEKTPGMVASLALILPGAHAGGALTIEHAGESLSVGAGGSSRWQWVAWYADCRHRLEPVESGVRMALTFAIAIDTDKPLTRLEPGDHRLGWMLWRRTYEEWHTRWAARGARTRAASEQYGQKIVWVLSHRYTEPGLRANLLKGRDRDLARLLVDEVHGEAAYLGWLQIREVGLAMTPDGALWGDHTVARHEPEEEQDFDPPPESLTGEDLYMELEEDRPPTRIVHEATPELRLDAVARQNTWIEGLRTLHGEEIDHSPIEVLDGEIVPPGALAEAVPDGARLYEATGNEGASIELQYRHAVLVVWRRNAETLRMLARCGGRLALAVELGERIRGSEYGHDLELRAVLELWKEALATDGGGAEPGAHRLVLDAMGPKDNLLREYYVEHVARVDLDAEAVPKLIGWIRESLEAGESMNTWVRAMRPACGVLFRHGAMNGAPTLLRALCESAETQALAFELLANRHDPPTSTEGVLRHAEAIEESLEREAWRRRRIARMTSDDVRAGVEGSGGC